MNPIDVEMMHTFLWIIGGLLSLLTAIIAWIGTRIYGRLEDINKTLVGIDKDLRAEMGKTNSRVAVLETKVENVFFQLKK